jgi:hypothetical protein
MAVLQAVLAVQEDRHLRRSDDVTTVFKCNFELHNCPRAPAERFARKPELENCSEGIVYFESIALSKVYVSWQDRNFMRLKNKHTTL